MGKAKKLTKPDEPSQTTEKGLEIPVPTKKAFESLLKRAAQGPSQSDRGSAQKR